MAIDERDRHRLHQRLDDVLGVAEAATLMSDLPPVGWWMSRPTNNSPRRQAGSTADSQS